MGRLQIRITDPTSHGGIIISGSANTLVNPLLEARITDLHACPLHGVNAIATGSGNTMTNGLLNARLFDLCICGAFICNGSPNTTTN